MSKVFYVLYLFLCLPPLYGQVQLSDILESAIYINMEYYQNRVNNGFLTFLYDPSLPVENDSIPQKIGNINILNILTYKNLKKKKKKKITTTLFIEKASLSKNQVDYLIISGEPISYGKQNGYFAYSEVLINFKYDCKKEKWIKSEVKVIN